MKELFINILALVQATPAPVFELGFVAVYGTLSAMSLRARQWCHSAVYGVAAALAAGLVVCLHAGQH